MTDTHHRSTSSLGDLTMLELGLEEMPPSGHHQTRRESSIILNEIQPNEETAIPKASLVIVTESEKLEDDAKKGDAFVSGLSDLDLVTFTRFKWREWDGTKFYSDYIRDGLDYLNKAEGKSVIMLFESPSSSTADSSFHNKDKYKFHDWPPPKNVRSKQILGPCKYASMNGTSYPVFLRDGKPPAGLMDHWAATIPGFQQPSFVNVVHESDTVYAYLPVEQIKNHVNDPQVHYHLVGKDSIVLMTQKTTKLLPDTRTVRPCVVKTTHSMGSKGIFIIQNDKDEAEFEAFLQESGNPTFVVTDFVDIDRNIACHFFMSPAGEIVWMGSNENYRNPDGSFSSDSYLVLKDQDTMKKMQAPFVEEVVHYCKSLNYWGFCGIDVLFDSKGRGYLVDINPRVTGSSPALMTLRLMNKAYGFDVGLFRRGGHIYFYDTNKELVSQVETFNKENEGKMRIVLFSFFEPEPGVSRMNIGVYGFDMEECKTVLNRFAGPPLSKRTTS